MGQFADAVMLVLTAGLVAWMIHASPLVDGAFKRWAIYLLMLGTLWGVVAHLGLLGHLRSLLR